MTKLMIDTSAYTTFKRGHSETKSQIRKASAILIPTVVLGELLAGFEAGSRRETNRSELTEFLANPRVSVTPVIESTTERYARIYAYLRKHGRPIPTNDLWIAASTMEHSAVLLTADMHFLDLPQIFVQYISSNKI